jgi:ribosomal 50S subunit-associated protein YjgA (DUF615 family)
LTDDGNSKADFGRKLRTLEASVSRRRQGQVIGQQLRNQFETLMAEPLPDHLLKLLDELEQRERGK